MSVLTVTFLQKSKENTWVLRRKFWSHSGGLLLVVTPVLTDLLFDLQIYRTFLRLKLPCLCKEMRLENTFFSWIVQIFL